MAILRQSLISLTLVINILHLAEYLPYMYDQNKFSEDDTLFVCTGISIFLCSYQFVIVKC